MRFLLLWSLIIPICAGSASGQDEALRTAIAAEAAQFEDRALGDLFGLRRDLSAVGLSIEPSIVIEGNLPLSGGRSQALSGRFLIDLSMGLDLDTAFGWEGGSLFLDTFVFGGRPATEVTGAFAPVSNLDLPNSLLTLAELWFEQVLFDGDLRIKLGKIDANTEFAAIDSAGGFLHSTAGFAPSIGLLPTYPNSALGLVVTGSLCSCFEVAGGLFDANEGGVVAGNQVLMLDGDAMTLLGEARLFYDLFEQSGRLVLGAWHHTGTTAQWSGGSQEGTTGGWITCEQGLCSFSEEDPSRRLRAFFQLGISESDTQSAERAWFGGLSALGAFDARPEDEIGLAFGHAELTTGGGFARDESFVELF